MLGIAAVVCAAFLAAARPASGQTVIYVDASATGAGNGSSWAHAYTSVQTALNMAQSGQQVWVAAGTFHQRVTLKLGVALYGGFAGTEDPATFDLADRDFAANETILDGNQVLTVVIAPAGATATTRIDGFTITNGKGNNGGGIYVSNSSPTIANNKITGNSATYYGGGLDLYYSSAIVVNNTITNNSAMYGAGLDAFESSSTITNNTIAGNISSHEGGGLYVKSSSPTITDNCITGNSARYGAALMIYYSSGTIATNTIEDNQAMIRGSGLNLFSSHPTITNNTIARNRYGMAIGGGLYLDSSAPTITSNAITGNSGTDGGGLYLKNSSPTIEDNTITSNSAVDGGGLHLVGSSPAIARNTIVGNGATNGGGVYLSRSSPTVANNVIAGNGATFHGGGMYLWVSSPAIVNNTVCGNAAGEGGGFYLSDSSGPIMSTIVAFNSSGVYGGGIGAPTLRYNCIYGNTGYDFFGVADPTGTDGNISADPLLADVEYGNAHVQPESPCVDAGDNYAAIDDFDVDGQPRIQPVGGTVDIGADESDGKLWPAGRSLVVRVSPTGDDTNDGSSWASAKRTVQAGIDAALALGGEVWVAAGSYYECVTLAPYTHLYGGFRANETDRAQRDWSANVTVLDGQQHDSVVSGSAGYTPGAIDGFTITKGSAFSGGGLSFGQGSLSIANNTITGNSASYWGGGLFLGWSSATITNNKITGNSATDGGGIGLYHGSPSIANNAVTGNRASINGGGLHLYNAAPTVSNTIVAFNSSGISRTPPAPPTLRYNCVFGNMAYNYYGLGNPTGTYGNISADPLFLLSPDPGPDGLWATEDDLDGDLRLLPESPTVDTGNNAYAHGFYDLDGHPRITDGDGNGVPTVDMGAFEYQAAVPGDLDGDGDVDGDDYSMFVAAFGHAVGQPGYSPSADLDGDGTVTLVDYQLWLECYRDSIGDPEAAAPGAPVAGDQDGDGVVVDFAGFAGCLGGPVESIGETPGCSSFDLDGNSSVDLIDFAAMQTALGK